MIASRNHVMTVCAMPLAITFSALSDAAVYWDEASWVDAVDNDAHHITFTELDGFAFLDDQYLDVGITFPESNDFVDDSGAFQQDGWGAKGFDATLTVDFVADVHHVAIYYPGGMRIDLYHDGVLVEEVVDIFGGYAFAGVVSDKPFDRVVFFDAGDGAVAIDDLYIPQIPAPPIAAVFLLALVRAPRRRV